MAGLKKVIEQVDRVAKQAAANVIEKMPSPGKPDAKQGEDCGCGRRKRRLVEQLRKGAGVGAIVEDLVDDLRGKPVEEPDETDTE